MASATHPPHPLPRRVGSSRSSQTEPFPVLHALSELREAVNHCRRCGLWRAATQGVPGEGAAHAPLILVGEQPGDREDLAGHPFVGPAGALLDRALAEAGIERRSIYLTNAVKHFKHEQRGKRRLHMKPSTEEIAACNGWLIEELRLVRPKLVLALGASAARALFGRTLTIASMRGRAVPLDDATHAWVTVHPSYLLRVPEEARRRAELLRFTDELKTVRRWLLAH
ncbi:MAG: UdgX family uracil-DNA binding protein [Steroidobacteraceae bacterium]